MFPQYPEFSDRKEAGQRLAQALRHHAAERPLVLGLPRGGVPVAHEVACGLDADLDLLIVRKLGAPGHEELGLGAVVDGADPQIVLNKDVVAALGVGSDYIEAETHRQLAEIERRRHAYLGKSTPIPVAHRTVILVDDGIATGGTVRAALRALRKAGADRIVLAVPVAPQDVLEALSHECDEIVCLASPYPFHAVGAHYANFDQTSDEDVVRLLARRKAEAPRRAARQTET